MLKDIYIIINTEDSLNEVVSAAFSEEEAIKLSGMKGEDFLDGICDLSNKQLVIASINGTDYENICSSNSIESILEFSNKIEAKDINDDAYNIIVQKVINKLDASNDKEKWIKALGLNKDNEYDELFDIEKMITN